MVHSSWEAQAVTSDGNTLQVHSFVSVSHPKRIIEVVAGAGHAPQMTFPKSLVMHVSAAVQASELTPGSTPAQQRVGSGSTVVRLAELLKLRLHDHSVCGVHGILVSTDVMALVMSLYR
jgi:hypothetical protein